MAELHIGCSAFTAAGFVGSLYPLDAKPGQFLSLYAERFSSVEVDSTYYRPPSAEMVKAWHHKTPDGFLFSLKTPKDITDAADLKNVEDTMLAFVDTCQLLREKLGVILVQLPYYNRKRFKTEGEFHQTLTAFLKPLSKTGANFAVEVRNRQWINEGLAEILRAHGVALVLQDMVYMSLPWDLKFDPITAPFTYCRLLGDRKRIDEITGKRFDKLVQDHRPKMVRWANFLKNLPRDPTKIWMYLNSHYEGSSFQSVPRFLEIWYGKPMPTDPGLRQYKLIQG
jgi:uncharacterized protein YecE (DUF72 family)